MASSSECSTDLAASASASADSAPELSAEQYDDDEFDDYSDSFESDSDAAGPEASGPAAVSSVADRAPLKAGDRVQVFWPEENEWFDGEIRRGEEGNEPRYFVHYDDGEQQWEVDVLPFRYAS
ncbi:unnamed protein product [Phytophthora lilii]|uniref:Unnamed protein product n=1 Tax=Phytophthora lilii TaxID=2077276 RepID=A0A9W6TA57_9STRA|nr:unnamed protein product [Phytophthora lilii]